MNQSRENMQGSETLPTQMRVSVWLALAADGFAGRGRERAQGSPRLPSGRFSLILLRHVVQCRGHRGTSPAEPPKLSVTGPVTPFNRSTVPAAILAARVSSSGGRG